MRKQFRGNFISRSLQLADGVDRNGIKRVQLLRSGTFKHPAAPNGAFSITPEILLKMKMNFDNNVRRLDKGEIPLDYGHDDGGKAAGWIEKIELEENNSQLWVDINYTPEAEKAVLEREWRFISADIDFEYEDNESGMKLGPVLLGAGLVNRPHIKSMKAVFGEIGDKENNEPTKPKGFSMTPEEMMKKIGELEAMVNQLKAQVASMTGAKADADKALGDMQKANDGLKEQLKEATAKVTTLSQEKETIAKEAKFAEFLKDGKVQPAQKESFMKMELSLAESLFKDAKPTLNLGDKGHGGQGSNGGGSADKSASEIVEERAAELMKNDKNIKLGEAYRRVLSADKELSTKYRNETHRVNA